MIVLWCFSLCCFVVVLLCWIVAHDRIQRQMRDIAFQREWWRTAAEDNFFALQKKKTAESKLLNIVARHRYIVANIGPVGVRLETEWNDLPPEKREYWINRAAEIIERGGNEDSLPTQKQKDADQ